MKRFILILTISMLASCVSHADTAISLQKLSNSNECQNLDKLLISDNFKKFEDFSIPNEDYLTIKLSDTKKNNCYSFKYFPSISPHLNLSIKNKKIVISEIVGSTLNGNQIKTSYSINLKQKKIVTLNSEMISFDVDEKGNLIKNVSNLLE